MPNPNIPIVFQDSPRWAVWLAETMPRTVLASAGLVAIMAIVVWYGLF